MSDSSDIEESHLDTSAIKGTTNDVVPETERSISEEMKDPILRNLDDVGEEEDEDDEEVEKLKVMMMRMMAARGKYLLLSMEKKR